jgi:hypothetical protein
MMKTVKEVFLQTVSPGPLRIPWGSFRIFTKIRGDVRKKRLINSLSSLAISLRVFVKIQNGPNKIQGARGKLIQEKTPFRTLKVMKMVYILTPVR